MTHTRLARAAGIVATGGLVMAALAAPGAALAGPPAQHTITICHATRSDSNPYEQVTVDLSSTGEMRGGHARDAGPVWDESLKARHLSWGDIIPAYSFGSFRYPGLNDTGVGLEIWSRGCSVSPVAVETPTDGAPSTETPTEEPTTEAPTGETPSDELEPGGQLTGETPSDPGPSDATPDAVQTGVAAGQAGEATPGEAAPGNGAPGNTAPTDETPTDAAPTDESPAETAPNHLYPGTGEYVVDGPFITPTPDPTPAGRADDAPGAVGAPGAPQFTPPATDTIGGTDTSTPGSGLQLLLLVLAGASTLVYSVGRVPATRRS